MIEEEIFHLSTEGYYFKYEDHPLIGLLVASLFKEETRKRIDMVKVKEDDKVLKTHYQVINYFESRITLKVIK